jgi:hypothetical protein
MGATRSWYSSRARGGVEQDAPAPVGVEGLAKGVNFAGEVGRGDRPLTGELHLWGGEDHVVGRVRHQGVERHRAGAQVAQGVHQALALLGQAGDPLLDPRRLVHLDLQVRQELLERLPGDGEVGL